MDGNDAGDKYIVPPEDILEPARKPAHNSGRSEASSAYNALRILEDANGALYVNPDVQHISTFRESSDLLSIYSREIQALRKVVSLLMGITLPLYNKLPTADYLGSDLSDYKKVIEYLQNASWELALVNDPKNPGSSPG